MAVFWGSFAVVLLTHLLTGTAEFRLDYSISRYVGLTIPSAIVFLLTNIVVSVLMWRFMKPKIKTKTQSFLIKYIIAMLILLSIFPIVLFDEVIPTPIIFGRAPISFLHVITSRTMFFAMAAFALATFYEGKSKKLHEQNVQKCAFLFFVFAALCVFVYIFFSPVFWQLNIVFESIYIAFFFFLISVF
jgi:hypothetical protein